MKLDNLIGSSRSAILDTYGNPLSTELSEYGSTWHIYHNRYKRFIMIGIKDDLVTNVYSNSADLEIFGVGIGAPRESVRLKLKADFGSPLTSIMKGTSRYPISDTDQKDVFTDGNAYYTFFYDMTKGGTLTAVQIACSSIEQKTGLFPAASAEMASAMENISFCLMNTIRIRMGKPAIRWDNRIAAIARGHSCDMHDQDYFGHTGPEGLNAAGRLKAAGLAYLQCSENIARNHPSAIGAFETFMNSAGHRKNILSSTECTGIGVYMGDGEILLTQMFVTLCD
ncbi:MAG: CAP domain-containing protein [Saccharofermentanales bacterium]